MLNMFTPGGFVYCFWKTAKGRLIALLILVGAVQFPLVMTPDRFSFAGDVGPQSRLLGDGPPDNC